MSPFAESGIAAARKRLAKALAELGAAVKAPTGDPVVWLHVGDAIEQVAAADGALADALRVEDLATVDTQRPAGGE
jgi:hypothetical protein